MMDTDAKKQLEKLITEQAGQAIDPEKAAELAAKLARILGKPHQETGD